MSGVDTPSTFPSLAHGIGRLWSLEPSQNDPRVPQKDGSGRPVSADSEESGTGPAASFRVYSSDPRVKCWMVWKPEHIVADYAVTVEYETISPDTITLSRDVLTECMKTIEEPPPIPDEMPHLPGLNDNPGSSNVTKIKKQKNDEEKARRNQQIVDGFGPFQSLLSDFAFYVMCGRDCAVNPLDNIPLPEVELTQINHFKPEHIEDQSMKIFAPNTVFKNVMHIDLRARGIRRIESSALEMLPVLIKLLLAFNQLDSLSFLPVMTSLEKLDVSYNFLQTLDNLKAVPSLTELDAGRNSLLGTSFLREIHINIPKLQTLTLAGNANLNESDYRIYALTNYNCLEALDGVEVTANHLQLAKTMAAVNTDLSEVVWIQSSFVSLRNIRRYKGGLISPSALRRKGAVQPSHDSSIGGGSMWICLGAILGFHDNATVASPNFGGNLRYSDNFVIDDQDILKQGVTVNTWRIFTEILDLSNRNLPSIGFLETFCNLKKVNVARNKLKTLTMFSACHFLEEIVADYNEIETLNGISGLAKLRSLSAGSNKIKDIAEIKGMQNLRSLSLDDNFLDTLDLFTTLTGIVELYLSNNLIEQVRSVLSLKPLPKLIILDLVGNDVAAQADYHQYTIYHLKRLKVLDGDTIRVSDQHAAETVFGGKLSIERMEEHLGPLSACYNFRSVDFSLCKLRHVGSLLNDDVFTSLRELCLDENALESICSIGPLTKLLVLRLNKNRLSPEGILPVEDGAGLPSLCHLQVLELNCNKIDDMSAFQDVDLPHLRVLHLAQNEIMHLTGINHFTQLRELVLDNNKIKMLDEDSLDGLSSLRELHMVENGLKTLMHFKNLPKIKSLFLTNNRLQHLSDLDDIRELKTLITLDLSQQALSRRPHFRTTCIHFFPQLKSLDGREIVVEERLRVDYMMEVGQTSQPSGPPSGIQAPATCSGYVVDPNDRLPPETVVPMTQLLANNVDPRKVIPLGKRGNSATPVGMPLPDPVKRPKDFTPTNAHGGEPLFGALSEKEDKPKTPQISPVEAFVSGKVNVFFILF